MPRYRAILFDLDETLLDFSRAQRLALASAFREAGLRFSPAVLTAFREINHAIWREYERGEIDQKSLTTERFRRLLRRVDEDPSIAAHLDGAFLRHLSRRGDTLPGCRKLLQSAGKNHRLAAVTNGIDRVQRSRVRAARIHERFEAVVTSESCGHAKPDPRIVEAALTRLDTAAGSALYVGDDPETDGRAARAAGVDFAWVAASGRRPSTGCAVAFRAGSLADLEAWLQA